MIVACAITGIVCFAAGLAVGWLFKPGGPAKGRCNAPLGGGRYCRAKSKGRCWRHPETARPQATAPAPSPSEVTP